MSYELDWSAIRNFLDRRPVVPNTADGFMHDPISLPVAGSAEWVALDDDDIRKTASLIVAGSRWVLEEQFTQIADRRAAEKSAATEISQARDWAAVAKRVRDRDQALRSGAYIPRKAS